LTSLQFSLHTCLFTIVPCCTFATGMFDIQLD